MIHNLTTWILIIGYPIVVSGLGYFLVTGYRDMQIADGRRPIFYRGKRRGVELAVRLQEAKLTTREESFRRAELIATGRRSEFKLVAA